MMCVQEVMPRIEDKKYSDKIMSREDYKKMKNTKKLKFRGKKKRKNKKAQSILDVFMFLAIAIVIIIFFVLMAYGIGLVNTNLRGVDIGTNSLGLNITTISDKTMGQLNIGMGVLDIVGFCLIFGMVLTIIISNFLVKAHPVFFVGYVLVGILAVIMSIMISSAYSDMLLDGNLGSELAKAKIGTYIMLHLPIWVTIITFLGAILLFAGIMRDEGAGGGI